MYGICDIIPYINNQQKENMNYYILRKQKLWDKWEYDTEPKARRGYTDLGEVSKKMVALENLNEFEGVEYIIVKDAMSD
jgi:hypothetical protein|tara:strand:- start:91 stop:327 length:237 start_codon:yes stop_codon:yes gene_type:complete